ncbi:MAG: class I SAM-dependent methyltransferase [Parafilimonas sp.]
MKNTQQAYNEWSQQYDNNDNKTRDLEALAIRDVLQHISFETVLEIGCGTGKNTEWFATKASAVTAVDFSEGMLAIARQKIKSPSVYFQQADITKPWKFSNHTYDLISFSLVLEHIQNLDLIFQQASVYVKNGGYIFIGELHPFKQYAGSKARFETANGIETVPCFNHNISDFTQAAKKYNFSIANMNEHFDDNDKTSIPRIFTLLLQKNE